MKKNAVTTEMESQKKVYICITWKRKGNSMDMDDAWFDHCCGVDGEQHEQLILIQKYGWIMKIKSMYCDGCLMSVAIFMKTKDSIQTKLKQIKICCYWRCKQFWVLTFQPAYFLKNAWCLIFFHTILSENATSETCLSMAQYTTSTRMPITRIHYCS